MVSLFENIKSKVLSAAGKETSRKDNNEVNNLISLGVLLWIVAESDKDFLPDEQKKLEEILRSYVHITDEDMPIVLRAVEEASLDRIDLFAFTSEVKKDIERNDKIAIVEHLFRVACVDGELHHNEHETIRKISGLFGLDHEEFIDAKVKVKNEFGMDTTGL